MSVLPPGAKNYLTASGAKKLREELDELLATTRPRLAASAEQSRVADELHRIDARIRQLQATLGSAVVVEPPVLPDETVRFGATVRVREPGGTEGIYRIVGVDETDLDRNWISWLSPLARALINARVGQRVIFKFPSGEQDLEILQIHYE
jgi:transcription elongation factor GreB